MQTTFESRLSLDDAALAILMAQADELSRLERQVFVALYVEKIDVNVLKRDFIARCGITARQFNALRINVQGKVAALEEAGKRCIDMFNGKMKAAQKKVKALQPKRGKSKKADERKRLAFVIQKKRRIATLAARIKQHEARLVGTPSICFGSRDLFRRQFHLKENGYADHANRASNVVVVAHIVL